MAHYVISSCVQFCWLSLVLLYWPLCPVSVLEHLTIATLSGKTNTENFLYPTLFLTNTPTILFPLMLHTELVKSTGSRSQFKDAGACIMRLGGCFSSLGFSQFFINCWLLSGDVYWMLAWRRMDVRNCSRHRECQIYCLEFHKTKVNISQSGHLVTFLQLDWPQPTKLLPLIC